MLGSPNQMLLSFCCCSSLWFGFPVPALKIWCRGRRLCSMLSGCLTCPGRPCALGKGDLMRLA